MSRDRIRSRVPVYYSVKVVKYIRRWPGGSEGRREGRNMHGESKQGREREGGVDVEGRMEGRKTSKALRMEGSGTGKKGRR